MLIKVYFFASKSLVISTKLAYQDSNYLNTEQMINSEMLTTFDIFNVSYMTTIDLLNNGNVFFVKY